ncbi:MAG: TolC family protein [Candidatus Sericytochromatia bacterium]|nr:TolC family protein [Candidatus Sericytochromatia bacterium]
MTPFTVLLGLPVVLLLAATPAGARPLPPEAVDLPGIVHLAREASPRLAPERERVAAAEARRLAAEAYPNPTLGYGGWAPAGGRDTIFTGSRQEDVGLDVPVLLPGLRGARVAAADRDLVAARARVVAMGSEHAAEAARAYVALLAAQERRAVVAKAIVEVERLRAVVSGRHASGAASRYEVLRAEMELSGWRTRLAEAEAEVADRQGSLATLLGLPGWRPRARGPLEPLDLATPTPEDVARAPVVAAARQEEVAAEAAIEVTRWARWPGLSFSLGRSWTAEPFGAAHQGNVSVELPFLDTRRGAVAEAEAEARAAALRRTLSEAEVKAGLERHTRVAQQRRRALDEFDSTTGRRLGELERYAEAAYQLGRTTLLEWLDAVRVRHELRLMRVGLVAGLVDAQVSIKGLQGFP